MDGFEHNLKKEQLKESILEAQPPQISRIKLATPAKKVIEKTKIGNMLKPVKEAELESERVGLFDLNAEKLELTRSVSVPQR